MQKEIFRRA